MNKYFSLLCILLVSFHVNAQDNDMPKKDQLLIKTETAGTFTSGDNAPFWLTNNKYGIGWYNKNSQYLRTGIFFDKKISHINISAGGDFVIANRLESDVFIQQLYADLKYQKIGLSLGQKERKMLFRNNELSTGSMTFSNNTRPLPQVEFSTLEFIPIPLTKDRLSFMGGLSYGWYTDNHFRAKTDNGNYVKNALYHHKNLFLKFESPNSNWNLIAGIEAATQWGGDRYTNGKYESSSPHSIKDAFKVLFNRSGGKNAAIGDQVNRLGETYGSYHLIFNYKMDNTSHLRLFYEHFFDDRSGMEYMNLPDGIYGIEYNFNKKQLFSTLLFEFIYTKSQSGSPEYNKEGGLIYNSHADDYYNNFLYVSNQHHGFTVGNPLITSPLYNKGKTLAIINNRIIAYHAGMSGWINNYLYYNTLLTYSRGYGTPFIHFNKARNEFMSSIEFLYSNPKLNGWQFSGTLAYDNSNFLIGDNFGAQLKISKEFKIK